MQIHFPDIFLRALLWWSNQFSSLYIFNFFKPKYFDFLSFSYKKNWHFIYIYNLIFCQVFTFSKFNFPRIPIASKTYLSVKLKENFLIWHDFYKISADHILIFNNIFILTFIGYKLFKLNYEKLMSLVFLFFKVWFH